MPWEPIGRGIRGTNAWLTASRRCWSIGSPPAPLQLRMMSRLADGLRAVGTNFGRHEQSPVAQVEADAMPRLTKPHIVLEPAQQPGGPVRGRPARASCPHRFTDRQLRRAWM